MSTRTSILTTVLTFSLATAALAAGASVTRHVPSGAADQAASSPEKSSDDVSDAADLHGGPIERVHEAAQCDLTDVTALSGNWTHGDYVSAVAVAGDPTKVQEAARSDCGMPAVATQGGQSHSTDHAAEGQSHAEGGIGVPSTVDLPSQASSHAGGS